MPQIKRRHDKAALLQHLCSDCKGTTSSKMDCKNLEKLMCFSCSRQDHYSGECNDAIRNGTPSLSKMPVARKEVQTQIDELKTHCNYSLRLLRSCGFVKHADTFETHKPDPHGLREPWEGSMVDLQPTYYDSSRKLTRLKQQLDSWRRYCLEIFEKVEQDGLAEAAMNPSVRWHIDPNFRAIEKFSKKVLSKIPTTVPATSSSVKAFLERMHHDIKAMGAMRGETLHWRYTIAIKLIHTAVRWRVANSNDEQEISLVGYENIEKVTLDHFKLLDKQFQKILETGLIKKGTLPYARTLCILETHQVTDFYPVSWKWLRGLFYEQCEDVALRGANNIAFAQKKGEKNDEAERWTVKRRKLIG